MQGVFSRDGGESAGERAARRSVLLLLLAGPGLVAAGMGCTSDLVRPTCDGALRLVVQGEVNEQAVDVTAPTIDGRWLLESFYFALPDPHRLGGTWLLHLGYNPELDDLGFDKQANLGNDIKKSGASTFRVLNHPPDPRKALAEQRCDPLAGELCGGLRVYEPGVFDIEDDLPGERPHDAYLPVKEGQLTLSALTPTALAGTFSLTLDWDRVDPEQGRGKLEGCFQATRQGGYAGDKLK